MSDSPSNDNEAPLPSAENLKTGRLFLQSMGKWSGCGHRRRRRAPGSAARPGQRRAGSTGGAVAAVAGSTGAWRRRSGSTAAAVAAGSTGARDLDQPAGHGTQSPIIPCRRNLLRPLAFLPAALAEEYRDGPFVVIVRTREEFSRWLRDPTPGVEWLQVEGLLGRSGSLGARGAGHRRNCRSM